MLAGAGAVCREIARASSPRDAVHRAFISNDIAALSMRNRSEDTADCLARSVNRD
jgi:hypothetical protein